MSSPSPVTIVIPVYNRAHTLPRLLQSIDAQTLAPAAVVLVDNASTDTSLSVLREWAETHSHAKVVTEKRPGASAARNRGLREVTTEWTMFFDSDDEMLPTHIADITRAISIHKDADIIGRDIITRHDGRDSRKPFTTSSPLFNQLFHSILSTQRYVAKTELFRNVGGWNESLKGWNDLELGVRLLLTSPTLASAGGPPSVIVHFQKESITGTNFTRGRGIWEAAIEAIRGHLATAGHTTALAWLDTLAVMLAATYHREGSGEAAHALLHQTLSTTPYPRRMKVLYLYHRLAGRLTWALAKIFFR